MFIDVAKIHAEAGKGGDGCISFRREACVPLGGPDGGDGGDGGSVFIEVDANLTTLLDFKYKRIYKAQNGEPGKGKNRFGKKGKDVVIKVPPGTLIKDAQTGAVIRDCSQAGESFCLFEGGRGGHGNARFATSTNQAPRIFTKGREAGALDLCLELKLLSDVGLVGLPNAGKSTLLSVVSAARPKIADYPFTTLQPVLGVVRYGNEFSFTVADIPGLIAGAHENRGLGHQFLRHIQRTKVLVFLLDMAHPVEGSPRKDLDVLLKELRLYDPGLADKPRLIAANKMDLPESARRLSALRRHLPGDQILPVSTATGEGVPELLNRMVRMLKTGGEEPV